MGSNENAKQNAPLRSLAPGERFCGWYLLKQAQSAAAGGGKP